MKELWFTLNKKKLGFFIWLMEDKKSVEDIIKRIEMSDNKAFIKLIKDGYIDDLDEWVLFVDNWKQDRYLIRLTHQPENKSLKIAIRYDEDRKSYKQEIDEVNEQLKQIGKHFYKRGKR